MADGSISATHTNSNEEDYTDAVCLLYKLTKRFPVYREVLIDAEDLEAVGCDVWYLNAAGKNRMIRVIRVDSVSLHRFIMRAPPGMSVDHRFHNTLDNRKTRMRLCTVGENNVNTRGSGRGTSKFKGVSWAKHVGKWYAQAGVRGNRTNLGYYEEEADAARAYNEYAKTHYGPTAYLNPV